MKTEIQLPKRIDIGEEREFGNLRYYFKILNKNIKIKKVGCTGSDYSGMVYVNSLKEHSNKIMLKQIKKEVSDFEKEGF